jgi:hypothetical protein
MNISTNGVTSLDSIGVRAHRRSAVLTALFLIPKVGQRSVSEAETGRQAGEGMVNEPEQRLWKVTAEAAAHHFAVTDVVVLLFFLVLAIIGIADCSLELTHLLASDAIGHIAAKAINP